MNNWVAEFVLSRQQNPRANASTLLSALKLIDSDDCVSLKITSVLRDISNCLLRGTVDEGMLDLLEFLEKLLLQDHTVIMGSLKSAYCWTAAECTVRFMWPVTVSHGFLSEAFERIWKKRIGILKERKSDLVTHELLKWESDLKKALEEPEIYQKIREINIRFNAISHLNQLLKEQWALLGCSSLESEVQKRFLKHMDSTASQKRGKASDTIDNVSEELKIDERMNNIEKANDDEEVVAVEDHDGVDKMNEQEQEHELSHKKRDRAGDSIDNVNEELRISEKMKNIEKAKDVEEGIVVEDPDVVEQEQEHELSHNNGDITVARELKDFLMEIQGLIEPSTRQEQAPDTVMNQSVEVTPQPSEENRIEAEDSQGTSSSGRVQPHQPTPEPLNVSPLKKGNLAQAQTRRPMKFWTAEEVEALKEGVKEYGKSWKDIKNSNPTVFSNRSEVDLKDKWRNLVR